MDRAVLLARRLRDDLHAGVEYLLAGQHQLGLAAPKQRREQLTKVAVNLLERVQQPLAGLAVNAADCVLERGERLIQVLRLRIEIILALLRRFQFLERREVDGAKHAELFVQPRDIGLQRARALALFELRLEFLLVGAGRSELLRELLLDKPRLLLLEPDFIDTLANRVQALLYRQPLLPGLMQLGFRRLERVARRRQRLLLLGAQRHYLLELGVERRLVEAAVFQLVLRDSGSDRIDVVDDQLDCSVDLTDLGGAGLEMKYRFLCGPLGVLQRLALAVERGFGLQVVVDRRGKLRLQFDAAFVELCRIGLGPVMLCALVARLGVDLCELDCDLFAALGHALRLFRELEYCELSLMMRLLQLLD